MYKELLLFDTVKLVECIVALVCIIIYPLDSWMNGTYINDEISNEDTELETNKESDKEKTSKRYFFFKRLNYIFMGGTAILLCFIYIFSAKNNRAFELMRVVIEFVNFFSVYLLYFYGFTRCFLSGFSRNLSKLYYGNKKYKDNIFHLSCIVLVLFAILKPEKIIDFLSQNTFGNTFVIDALSCITASVWYFVNVYFLLLMSWLIGSSLKSLLKNVSKRIGKGNVSSKKVNRYRSNLSKLVLKNIDNLALPVAFIYILFASIVDFVLNFAIYIINMLGQIIVFIIWFIKTIFRIVKNRTESLKGKIMFLPYLIAKVSLIVSMVITNIIIQYGNYISLNGKTIYNFIISVVVVPIVITEIISLKAVNECSTKGQGVQSN